MVIKLDLEIKSKLFLKTKSYVKSWNVWFLFTKETTYLSFQPTFQKQLKIEGSLYFAKYSAYEYHFVWQNMLQMNINDTVEQSQKHFFESIGVKIIIILIINSQLPLFALILANPITYHFHYIDLLISGQVLYLIIMRLKITLGYFSCEIFYKIL